MKLLVTTFIDSPEFDSFKEMFDEIVYEGMMKIGRVLTEDELCEYIKDVDVLIPEFDPITKKVIDAANNLKLIASPRGGAKANIDIEYINKKKIPVLFVPGRNQDTVADFTMGMLIDVCRGISLGNHLIKNRVITDVKQHFENGFCKNDVNWVGSTPEKFAYLNFKGPTLNGKRLGLIGYGAIGRETAKRALAFGMEIVTYDPFVRQEDIELDVKLIQLKELMKTSDFISVHIPVTDDTRGLINSDMLSLMKRNAYLINTARAAVMNYDKLILMLQNNEIAGAAFDVYPIEPLPDNHPLLTLDNVVLTPHIGGCSFEPYDRSYKMLAEDVKRFFNGERPLRLYNPEIWDN